LVCLREEHRLRVFENRVLRRIFGPKRDEVTGKWRKLHNEELHNLYSTPDIIWQVKANAVDGACSTHGRVEKSAQGFGGKSRRKEPLGRPRRRLEDGIRMDLRDTFFGWVFGFYWLRIGAGGGLL
jgi:hypothetical protein